MMGAYVTFNANVSTLAQVDEKAFFIHAFQREDMFLDVFCPRSVIQSLVVWFDGFHLLSGRSFSSRDSLVSSRQV